MSSWTTRLKNRMHPRLRMFFARLFLLVVTWLAVTGAIEMIRGNAAFSPLVLTGLVLGLRLIHSQKATAVASATADRKLAASLS
jgi:hypothetical protein